MPRRQASPAQSEPELDILSSIYPGGDGNADDGFSAINELDFGNILDAPRPDEDEDEAFIALQQAAANRKTSNLKGRTVKKGGGFQAMGMIFRHSNT